MSDIIIRIAEPADANAVSEIAKECWRGIYEGYLTEMGEEIYNAVYPTDPLAVKGDKVAGVVREGKAFVAVRDGEICGFATYAVEGKIGVLKDNAVKIGCQGLGIAGRLYDAVFAKLREVGCSIVRVGTGLDDAHAPARRAYAKMGFERGISNVTYYKKL